MPVMRTNLTYVLARTTIASKIIKYFGPTVWYTIPNYLAPGGGCEVLFSPGLSVCLSVCLCVCVCVSGRYFGILFLSYFFIGQRSRSQGRYIAF